MNIQGAQFTSSDKATAQRPPNPFDNHPVHSSQSDKGRAALRGRDPLEIAWAFIEAAIAPTEDSASYSVARAIGALRLWQSLDSLDSLRRKVEAQRREFEFECFDALRCFTSEEGD
jgi:hypothetical protein